MSAMAATKPSNAAIDLLRQATDFLRQRGVGNPRLDAEVLLADVLGVDRVGVYLNHDRPLCEAEIGAYRERIRRRGRREPLQHIRGRQEFFSREFLVDSRVLVPRPETETLVEVVLAVIAERPGTRILDVGAGSGAVAVTLALEAPAAQVFAVDVSPEAVEVGRANAERLGAAVEFRHGDLFAPWGTERFDVVVSNPPYVPTRDIDGLDPEVREFDPRMALDGGTDGLGFVRRLAAESPGRLVPGGMLAVEIGFGQAGEARKLFAESGFSDVVAIRDLEGRERVVRAQLAGAG